MRAECLPARAQPRDRPTPLPSPPRTLHRRLDASGLVDGHSLFLQANFPVEAHATSQHDQFVAMQAFVRKVAQTHPDSPSSGATSAAPAVAVAGPSPSHAGAAAGSGGAATGPAPLPPDQCIEVASFGPRRWPRRRAESGAGVSEADVVAAASAAFTLLLLGSHLRACVRRGE